ncbi:hypothetical protein [Roseibacillus persicicus]|uniref:hypothetical protein n=1 Tax=Roseibacillus persicicus TaxID=454148 RepID=UPI00280FB4CF|nr:hypothetical protein [Roseibacillus persicicus]MDQ8189611.1 hypothetical protein [Roseibacillus persicicus]
MKSIQVFLFVKVSIAALPCVQAQAGPVDWLTPSGVTNGDFFLLDDSDSVLAEVSLAVLAGFPLEVGTANRLDGVQWEDGDLVPTNTVGDRAVDGFLVRVAPIGSVPSWTITLDLSQPGDWWLAVGSLYRDDSFQHGPLGILANDGVKNIPLEYQGMQGWNGGAGALTGAMEWNATNGQLQPSSGNDGESGIAFFNLKDFGGSGSQVTIEMPSGFAAGAAGDDVFFALGYSPPAIPEPASGILCSIAAVGLWRRRR